MRMNHPMVFFDMMIDDDASKARRLKSRKDSIGQTDDFDMWFGNMSLSSDALSTPDGKKNKKKKKGSSLKRGQPAGGIVGSEGA
eukprot:CAMPEP_0176311030 /NCGR_PEP_ID=MMETSP0121_2-20121125/65923_1 /TAXON_ID=160619 /ORGANISM="Kryptoperidinium foliaceum, Strain CCMP 1326" /LENGTH=83 /DNA_ID=CAMNT_0017653029 /DNA_START=6 /DNA_END=254 /DNA_ORIENTATION=-